MGSSLADRARLRAQIPSEPHYLSQERTPSIINRVQHTMALFVCEWNALRRLHVPALARWITFAGRIACPDRVHGRPGSDAGSPIGMAVDDRLQPVATCWPPGTEARPRGGSRSRQRWREPLPLPCYPLAVRLVKFDTLFNYLRWLWGDSRTARPQVATGRSFERASLRCRARPLESMLSL